MEARKPIGGIIFITHGEADAIEVLRRELQALGTSARIVAREIGERDEMTAGNPAKRIEAGRTNQQDAVGGD